MKVLLIGGGGREHALGWKIAQSPLLERLFLAPGNPGLNHLDSEKVKETGISDADTNAIVQFASDNGVDLVVIGPEAPLAAGLADKLAAVGVPCFGASAEAARLESSKAFTKDICAAVNAPTARHETFTRAADAKTYLKDQTAPFVVKADGLAAGKGVFIAETLEDAFAAVDTLLAPETQSAGSKIVIEEFMRGEEASFFVLCDGERAVPLLAAQDHKRAFDGDKGPNTGGMGAYAPAPVFTTDVRQKTMDKIIAPVLAEMARRGAPFRGVLFAGLMIEDGDPRLVEFNVRFGDPETQVLMLLMESDLLPLLRDAAMGALDPNSDLRWRNGAAATVVMATDGYPGAYAKGSVITGVNSAEETPGVVVFHAGTAEKDNALVANGGRVLNVTAHGGDIRHAVETAYTSVTKITWPEGFYRRDIGWRAIEAASGETS